MGAGSAGDVEGLAVTVEMTESGVSSRLARGVEGPMSYQPSQCGTANTSTKVMPAATAPIQMPAERGVPRRFHLLEVVVDEPGRLLEDGVAARRLGRGSASRRRR